MNQPGAASTRNRFAKGLIVSTLLLALLLQIAVIVRYFCSVAVMPYDLTNALEGNLLEGGMRVREGDLAFLYSPADQRGFAVLGYQPLYYFIEAALFPLLGCRVLVPKLITVACFLLSPALVYIMARRRTGVISALAGTLIALQMLLGFFGFPVLSTVDYPLLFLTTLVLFAAPSSVGFPYRAFGVGMIAGVEFLAKQSGLFTMVAVSCWYLARDPKRFFMFALGWTLLGLLPVIMLNRMTGGQLFFHGYIIMSRVPILDYWKLWYEAKQLIAVCGWPLVVGLIGAFLRRDRSEEDRLSLWILCAWILGMGPSLAKDGTSMRYLAPVIPAMAFLFSASIQDLIRAGRVKSATVVTAICILFLPNAFTMTRLMITPEDWKNGSRLEEWIRRTRGPVLTDRHFGLLLAVGKRPEYDMSQIWWFERRLGIPALAGLHRDLLARRYDLILMSEDYLLPETRSILDKGYRRRADLRIKSASPGRFYYCFVPWVRSDLSDSDSPLLAP